MRYNDELIADEEYDESRISYGCREIYDYEGNKEIREREGSMKYKNWHCRGYREFLEGWCEAWDDYMDCYQ